MTWQYTPYNIPLLATAALSVALAAYIWPRRRSPGAVHLFAVMVAVSAWTLAYALQMASVPARTKLLYTQLEFVAILCVPTLWLAFALDYTGRTAWLRRFWPWLVPVPVATAAVLWTNPWHHWFWSAWETHPYHGFVVADGSFGPGFWAHALYSYALLVTGNVLLLHALLRSATTYRRQFAAAMLGSLAPWLANALTIFDAVPFPYLDLTPFAFCVSGLSLGWGLYRFRLLDLIPVAQDLAVRRMRDALLLVDSRGRILELNAAALALIDGRLDPVGGDVLELLPSLTALFVHAGTKTEVEAVVTHPTGGHTRHYQAQMVSLGQGEPSGHLIVLHDITTRLRAEARLRELKEAADAASRAKSHFLAHMNHELRNPLTAIMGAAELLEIEAGTRLDDSQRQLLATIVGSSEQLLEMINESLDMSRIEAGKVTVHAETFDVDALLAELADAARGLAGRRRNRLRVVGAGTAGEMTTDRAKVRQCVLNLLTNAAKFTADGEITLSVDRADPEVVRIAVRDTGIGIEAAHQARIFEPFSQAEPDTSTRFGGTGLGLSIARTFARLLGGDLTVESTPGVGSIFTLTLPARLPAGRGGDPGVIS